MEINQKWQTAEINVDERGFILLFHDTRSKNLVSFA